ncbi:MAG: EF-hand domain-containing protein [Verrucomicrobiota bacterium]
MKTTEKILTVALSLSAATLIIAQDGPPGGGPGGQGGPGGGQPPKLPLLTALDADGNGEISATEISNAATALKALDKNGDGKLSRDEYMGQRPGGPGGGQR